MKKWIILLSIIGVIILVSFLFVRTSEQKQPVTTEETIDALKSILQEYGYCSHMKDWKMEINECCITVEYEKDDRKYRIAYPTTDVDKMEVERTGGIYMLCYHSEIASFTDLTGDDRYLADEVPFMYVDVPLSKEEIVKMIQRLGDACVQIRAKECRKHEQ